jgi:hypothetical protein
VGVGAGWEVVDEVVGGEAPVVFGSTASMGHLVSLGNGSCGYLMSFAISFRCVLFPTR